MKNKLNSQTLNISGALNNFGFSLQTHSAHTPGEECVAETKTPRGNGLLLEMERFIFNNHSDDSGHGPYVFVLSPVNNL